MMSPATVVLEDSSNKNGDQNEEVSSEDDVSKESEVRYQLNYE